MKANVICPNCDLIQQIDNIELKDIEKLLTKCPNCHQSYRSMTLVNESLTDTQFSSTQNILTEASAIINGERLDTYGNPEDSFKIIARFWKVYLAARSKLPESLNALDVAHMMTLFKLARLLGQKPDRDNYRDACGYLAIAADRLSSDRSS